MPFKILDLEREDYNKFLLEEEFIFNRDLELFKKRGGGKERGEEKIEGEG